MKKKYSLLIIAVLLLLTAVIFIVQRTHAEFHAEETGSVLTDDKDRGENMAGYTSITMEQAKDIFKNEGSYLIVDVRRPDEYAEGHIPGAINIVNEEIADKKPEELPDQDQIIYVYCRSGRRSKEAAGKLAALGYTNIIEFGGILDWTGEIE